MEVLWWLFYWDGVQEGCPALPKAEDGSVALLTRPCLCLQHDWADVGHLHRFLRRHRRFGLQLLCPDARIPGE